MQRMLAGPLPRADAWLVRLAADGLWFADLLGIAAPAGEDRRCVVERMLALATSVPGEIDSSVER
jgi:hypothetical protein